MKKLLFVALFFSPFVQCVPLRWILPYFCSKPSLKARYYDLERNRDSDNSSPVSIVTHSDSLDLSEQSQKSADFFTNLHAQIVLKIELGDPEIQSQISELSKDDFDDNDSLHTFICIED